MISLSPSLFSITIVLLISFVSTRLRCPKDVRSDFVKNSFSFETFADGELTYELGYKDMTQPRVLKCITGRKNLLKNNTILHDDFIVQYSDKTYKSNLTFALYDDEGKPYGNGIMVGKWNLPLLKNIDFPNQVVDVGYEKREDGSYYYKWMVEFQCIEVFDHVAFYAFNFYSKTNTLENYDAMYKTAVKHGLKPFIDDGSKDIKIVVHDETCWYNNKEHENFRGNDNGVSSVSNLDRLKFLS